MKVDDRKAFENEYRTHLATSKKPDDDHLKRLLWWAFQRGAAHRDAQQQDCKGSGRDNVPYGEHCDTCRIAGKMERGDTSLEYDPDDVAFKPAPNLGTPCITFEPFTPPRPTLDQMPEGEPHRCKIPGSPHQIVRVRRGNVAYSVNAYGEPVYQQEGAHDYLVLDADPPQPKTLADVPAGVWCITVAGNLASRNDGGMVYYLIDGGVGPCKCNSKPEEMIITRVLGTPKLTQEQTDA